MKTLRERNQEVLSRICLEGDEVQKMRKSFVKNFGYDYVSDPDKKFPVLESDFSWKKVQDQLEESDAASAFPQFLRAGIQTIAASMYQATPTTMEDWVTTVPSGRLQELYPLMHGPAFPKMIAGNQKYAEVGSVGFDLSLMNYKYGSIYAVQKELLDDEQGTGVFQRNVAMLGEYCKLVQEVWCYGKLASVSSMQYADLTIPTSETKPSAETTWPWSTSLIGGGATRPNSYGLATQANIQSAKIALMNQKNALGLKMVAEGNRIIAGPQLEFDLKVLLNSSYYPSGAASAGAVGGAFAINPLFKGIANVTISRFMFKSDGTVAGDSKAWYLVDDSKPWFILQLRDAVSTQQEAVNSGKSFDEDVYRFKVSTRFNADFLEPRFAYQGNDGSVTS